MTQPTLEDARGLSEWRPPLGVLSVYLGFDPADRGGAWRTELRNGARRRARGPARSRARPPGGAAGNRETADGALRRRRPAAAAPRRSGLRRGGREGRRRALVRRLVGSGRQRLRRVRPRAGGGAAARPLWPQRRRGALPCSPPSGCGCFCFAEGALEEIEDWELSITSLDWRERKAQSASDPARAQGVGSSGHDQFEERLDHNRQRFLAECGGLAARRLEADGLEEADRLRRRQGDRGLQVGLRLLAGAPQGRRGAGPDLGAEGQARRASRRGDRAPRRRTRPGGGGAGLGGGQGRQPRRRSACGRRRRRWREGRVDHLVFDGGIGERGGVADPGGPGRRRPGHGRARRARRAAGRGRRRRRGPPLLTPPPGQIAPRARSV